MAASNVIRRVITCNSIARPVGPYSHAVIVGQTMYVSGSIGMDKEGQLVPGGIKEQTRQALENVKAILSTGGCQLGNVVKTTVLLSDIKHYAEFNSIYSEYFPDKPPARAAYQVAALPKNALVEIEAIAVIGDIIDE